MQREFDGRAAGAIGRPGWIGREGRGPEAPDQVSQGRRWNPAAQNRAGTDDVSVAKIADAGSADELLLLYGLPSPGHTPPASQPPPADPLAQDQHPPSSLLSSALLHSNAPTNLTKTRLRIHPGSVSWSAFLAALGAGQPMLDSLAEAYSRDDLGATPENVFSQRAKTRWKLAATLVRVVPEWPRMCLADKTETEGERVWEEMTERAAEPSG